MRPLWVLELNGTWLGLGLGLGGFRNEGLGLGLDYDYTDMKNPRVKVRNVF